MKSEGSLSAEGGSATHTKVSARSGRFSENTDTSDQLCNIKCNCKYCKGLRSDQEMQEDVEEVDEEEVDKEEENARASYKPSGVRSEW